ncbi:uncharacterized protein PAC_12992 [Phialocephala subalpina]|uniref:Uncharacterized protein n=1 Tax=Phialocephala subalpina TaxID=576137 RepID=A0A1L7XDI4_9HELO|nr:uncharacterized protein PAC_12992 [Phialocephala subalpina]
MDPLSALSVAGTIIQFVDFGTKLLTSSVQLYKSSRGSLKAHEELELIVADLQSVIVKLRGTDTLVAGHTVEEASSLVREDDDQQQSFMKICDEATRIADELLMRLNALRVKDGKNRVWQCLKTAVREAWTKSEIDSLMERLLLLKRSLDSGSVLSLGLKDGMSRDMIDVMTQLICRSEVVNQDAHHDTRQMVSEQRNNNKARSLGVDIITAQFEMLNVSHEEERGLRRTVQIALLELLKYPYMTDRYEQLVQPHPKTFDWIFATSDDWEFRWTDFGKWLREGTGIYWINGKAASGKSTLMKHIYDDSRTVEYIREWSRKSMSGPVPICIATFFFWSSGTSMQKSQEGLIRSLLFQVLSQHPCLVPFVFPTRWANLYVENLSVEQEVYPKPWSSRELHEAFERLIFQDHYRLNIFFLLDGLDEFYGDSEQLCLLFKQWSEKSRSVKICLSSRPWLSFQDAFEDCASLRLQDLTGNDIAVYVNDKLYDSPSFARVAARKKKLAPKLVLEIVNRAEGIFLWVEIVVRLLLKGIHNHDTVSQLWTRLRSYPTELDALYESILSHIEPIYFEWASKAFQLMIASAQLSSDPFRRLVSRAPQEISSETDGENDGVRSLTLIEFSIALQEAGEKNNMKIPSPSELVSQFKTALIHITARCADLLEVPDSVKLEDLRSSITTIRWVHRTAHDFVCESTIWTKTMATDCFREPSVCTALMEASIISLNILKSQDDRSMSYELRQESLTSLASNALMYAYHADGHSATRKARSALLTMMMNMYLPFLSHNGLGTPREPIESDQRLQTHKTHKKDPSEQRLETDRFLERAALHSLKDFVEDLLMQKDQTTQRDSAKGLMKLLCSPGRFASLKHPCPSPRILQYLLKTGEFQARRVSEMGLDLDYWPRLPGIIGTSFELSVRNQYIPPLEASRLVDSQLFIIELFLKLDADPTDSMAYVPKDFIFNMKKMQEIVGSSIQTWISAPERSESSLLHLSILLGMIREALIDEVRLQKATNESARKRKRSDVPSSDAMPLQTYSDVMPPEERSSKQEKRIKLSEDDLGKHEAVEGVGHQFKYRGAISQQEGLHQKPSSTTLHDTRAWIV